MPDTTGKLDGWNAGCGVVGLLSGPALAAGVVVITTYPRHSKDYSSVGAKRIRILFMGIRKNRKNFLTNR